MRGVILAPICALTGMLFLFLGTVNGQDTTTIQTFTWESQTRSEVFDFNIDTSKSYRKILMTYNMHCHDDRVGSGNVGCREWDYSCNTFITDSSKVDSVLQSHPNYLINGFSGDQFKYSSSPTYDFRQFERITTSAGMATQLDTIEIFQSDSEVSGWQRDQIRYQFIITKDELNTAGIQTGDIQGLELPFQIGDFMTMSFSVKIGMTSADELDTANPVLEGLTSVYFNQLEINSPGMNQLLFHTPFNWDGFQNLIIELAYNDKMTPTPEKLKGFLEPGKSIIANETDHVFTLNGGQYIEIASTDVDEIENEITVLGWFYGFPDQLPANTYMAEGVDEDNNRQFNVHLPWSNGTVYFDCGNDGSGYDRISKEANEEDYEGKWNHWAFTKNVITGSMKIYLNGELWHSGNGKTKSISIDRMNLGKGVNTNGIYNGQVNEFSIWKKELSKEEINRAMKFVVNDQHTAYKNLLVHLEFEEMNGSIVLNAQNNQDYKVRGSAHWHKLRGDELYFNFEEIASRPAISFLQGNIERVNEVNVYRDSMLAAKSWVRPFEIISGDLEELTSELYWEAGYSYVIDEKGEKVDSIYYLEDGIIEISDLNYFLGYPSKFELLSLVTPYGNGLSLGKSGKTFTFDVTDFASILKGKKRLSVEMGGQWQEDLDVQFHFIEGTPKREVLDIQNIWKFGRGNYGAIQDDSKFESRMVALHPDGKEYKIRSSITGHGQNGEFQARDHYLNINGGGQEFVFRVWKECSTIPIYPQGGTWIFDRAGWCPGDPTLLFEHDVTDFGNPGEMIAIDYGVNGPHMDQANYLVSHQLVSYGPTKFANNATLLNIVRPSTNVEWERENPSCNKPTIIIQNSGYEKLQYATIEYGIKGGVIETYNWAGNLEFGESDVVELPIRMENFWEEVEEGRSLQFVAKIVGVNRTNDENMDDNTMESTVGEIEILKGEFQLDFSTNSRGSETSFDIRDDKGEVVYSGDGYGPNQRITIDLDLSPGCYTLDFRDAGDDGLYYWFWEQTGQNRGRGFVRINKDIRGRKLTYKSFEAEFGRFIHYDFVIDGLVGNKNQRILRHLNIFPNPNDGMIVIDFFSEQGEDLRMDIISPSGRLVSSEMLRVNAGDQLKQSVIIPGGYSGMYLIRFTQDDRTTTKRIMVER